MCHKEQFVGLGNPELEEPARLLLVSEQLEVWPLLAGLPLPGRVHQKWQKEHDELGRQRMKERNRGPRWPVKRVKLRRNSRAPTLQLPWMEPVKLDTWHMRQHNAVDGWLVKLRRMEPSTSARTLLPRWRAHRKPVNEHMTLQDEVLERLGRRQAKRPGKEPSTSVPRLLLRWMRPSRREERHKVLAWLQVRSWPPGRPPQAAERS